MAKASVSMTASSPVEGMDTNRRVSSRLFAQSVPGPLRRSMPSVLVLPTMETSGSMIDTVPSRFMTKM